MVPDHTNAAHPLILPVDCLSHYQYDVCTIQYIRGAGWRRERFWVARLANPSFQSDVSRAEMSMSPSDSPQPDVAGDSPNSEKMSLPEHIVDLCRRGALPTQFRVNDVRQALGDQYAETYIRRALGL